MTTFRKLVLGSWALALAAVAAVNVSAATVQEGQGKMPFTRGDRMVGGFGGGAPMISIALKHKAELNLTNDQVANLEKIRTHHQSQVTPIQQQLTANEKEVSSLMQQTPANLIQIKAKIQEAEKFRSELRYLRIEALENGRTVLSAQQQDQLKSLIRTSHDHFRKSPGQPS
jgi:Spy/CpxP family protein refolding chaperone